MADDAFCPECGNRRVHVRVASVTHTVGHRTVEIAEDRHLYCPDCGMIGYDGAMLDENQKAIACQIRKDEGLLTPEELRTVRLKYGLTQAEMERLLQIGPKTWVRWERGKVVQSQAADQLIRQIARNPDVLRDLMACHDVRSPTADRVLSDIDQSMEQRLGDRLRAMLGADISDEVVRDVARLAVTEIRALRRSEDARIGNVANG